MNPKIKTQEELKSLTEILKKENKTVITTNGAYDILHLSHINLLKKIKDIGGTLIVLLNSDDSIKAYKGEDRPIIPEQERAEMLAALESVDYVTIFKESKPLDILKEIQPHIHTKGYQGVPEKNKEEEDLVESWGGKLQLVNSEGEHSTTDIIKKILDTSKNETV